MKSIKNKSLKIAILSSVITFVITVTIGVTAVAIYAKDIEFKSNDENWQVDNVEDAMNDLYEISSNQKSQVLETGSYTFSNVGHGTTSSTVTITFENTYTAEDNVYLMIYKTEQGNISENIFVRGMKQVTGNQTGIQVTNIGSVNGVNDKIYYALVQLEK